MELCDAKGCAQVVGAAQLLQRERKQAGKPSYGPKTSSAAGLLVSYTTLAWQLRSDRDRWFCVV